MLEYNQCFAPSHNGRCRNKCITNSKHCELHNPKSTKLYLKYKKLSVQTKNIDLNKKFNDILSNINYITKCYDLYNKTFEARLKHRKFAIVPNLYDQGHDFQFTDLKNKINECEDILNRLYISYEFKNKNITFDEDDSRDDDDNNSIVIYDKKQMMISRKIKLNKEYRLAKEREINIYVEKYIKENELIIERKRLLIYNLCMCISLLFGEDELTDRPKIIAMICLIAKLNNIDYFKNDFIPRTCKHPECTCKLPYDLSLGSEFLQDDKCFCQFMELFSEEVLKSIFEIFLFNKRKILPFVNDINDLYEEYDDDINYINVELVWKKNRLNLKEKLYEEEEQVQYKKHSERFAITRLKDKYYERELMKNLF
jgi:hypothetical protein